MLGGNQTDKQLQQRRTEYVESARKGFLASTFLWPLVADTSSDNQRFRVFPSIVPLELPIRLALGDHSFFRDFLQCHLLIQVLFAHDLCDPIADRK